MDYQSAKAANKALNFAEAREGRSVVTSRPLFFWFELAGPCNLKCAHCGFQKYGRTSNEQIQDRIYDEVMKELMPTALVCNLGGTNWGESTLAKNFHRFLLDCKKYEVQISLTTNGTRMQNDWFDDLLDVLTVIGFSMEGIDGEFEKMRGFKWSHFLKNVERVCQGRARRGKTFQVEWRYCAHADSIHQLPDMIRLAHSVGVDRIQVMNLVPYVATQKYKNLTYHRSLANQYFAEGRMVARDLNIDINIPADFDTGDFVERSPLIQLQKTRGPAPVVPVDSGLELVNCYRPWQACVIDELGSVRPCCVYWKPMGSIAQSSFESVWNGRRYRKLRETTNTKSDPICFACRMPQFDSDQNRSASQLAPSIKEMVKQTITSIGKKPRVAYTGIMDERYDPRPGDARPAS